MTSPFAGAQLSFAEIYERFLVGPLFGPWATLLIDRVGLAAGNRILDVACGTGTVARQVRQRFGSEADVVGVDLSPAMLAVARSVAPTIDWREGNAAALPLESARFDVVFCQQGLQFMPEKEAALGEMRRVLAPGGKLGLAVWRGLEEMPFVVALHRVAERHLGSVTDTRHSFGDADRLRRMLEDAGFRNVRIEVLSLPARFEDHTFVRLNAMALIGMSSSGKALTDDERAAKAAAIAQDSAEVLGPFREGEGLRFDLRSNVAVAEVA